VSALAQGLTGTTPLQHKQAWTQRCLIVYGLNSQVGWGDVLHPYTYASWLVSGKAVWVAEQELVWWSFDVAVCRCAVGWLVAGQWLIYLVLTVRPSVYTV
jgi:hypothetical protein